VTERGPSPLSLGEIIRRQRELAELPMRQLAAMVGISNPYLSQIEHGLRDPSEQVLEGIARSLQTSVDELLDAAGSGPDKTNGSYDAVLDAVRADPNLTARQRLALSEVYLAMTEATAARRSQRRRSG
jgi:transcriptional regulator with XRE-family HTH domain